MIIVNVWAGRFIDPPANPVQAEQYVREAVHAHRAITSRIEWVAHLVQLARDRKLPDQYGGRARFSDSWDADVDEDGTVAVYYADEEGSHHPVTFPVAYLWHPDPWQAEIDRMNNDERIQAILAEADDYAERISERLKVRQEMGA